MKLTVMNWQTDDELESSTVWACWYRKDGYADGSRQKQRQGVIYADRHSGGRSALVWGGPEHIRVQFLAQP